MNHQFSPTIHPYYQKQPFNNTNVKYALTVQQQPRKARLCSFKDKVDRRPLDPPPIVQLHQSNNMNFNDYHNSANFFLHTTLVNSSDNIDIHHVNGNKTTAGSVVQSLHKLKDTNNTEGAFFIFADISIRIEGIFKLKFTLFQIKGIHVERVCSVLSDPFRVYSPKTFPGMSESTDLTRSFSDQGVRIRIRKEARAITPSMKRRRGMDRQQVSPKVEHEHEEEEDDDDEYERSSLTTTNSATTTTTNHVMSMQNLLITDSPPPPPTLLDQPQQPLFPRTVLPAPHALEPSLITPSTHYYTATSTPSLPNPLSNSPQDYNLPALIRPASPNPYLSYYHLNHNHLNRENSP